MNYLLMEVRWIAGRYLISKQIQGKKKAKYAKMTSKDESLNCITLLFRWNTAEQDHYNGLKLSLNIYLNISE